jgi:MYXO-CTERM domain-containing protein
MMRKTLTVLALTAALTGGATTVALAADAPATTPHQLSQPTAAAASSNAPSDKTGLWGLLGLLGLAGLVKRKDANTDTKAISSR